MDLLLALAMMLATGGVLLATLALVCRRAHRG